MNPGIQISLPKLPPFGPEFERKVGRICHRAARGVEARYKIAIKTGPKTGRIYELGESEVDFTTASGKSVKFTARKGKKKKQHQASAPGEAPASDTGFLANSAQTTQVGVMTSEVTVGAEYGATLEYGSADGKIAPRPAMGPAVDAELPGFNAAIDKLVENEWRAQR